MQDNKINSITTPAGRLVMGSLYEPNLTDMHGKPLEKPEYFFAIAVPKQGELHWNQTSWGAIVWNIGQTAFPNGAANHPTFAWKIDDGDRTEVNPISGRRPCDNPGFPGCWIVKFKSQFAPGIYKLNNESKAQEIIEKDFINPGDYVQVFAYVNGNNTPTHPGVYLNHKFVCFVAYGDRINYGPSADAVGFGNTALPAGASLTPKATSFNPAMQTNNTLAQPQNSYRPAPSPAHQPIMPHYDILQAATLETVAPPPAPTAPPAQPIKRMTPSAGNFTYEQYIKAGWTDENLIAKGYLIA